MTRIELKNGYYIDVDSLNYTLRQKYIRNAKDGSKKEAYRTCGHFSDIRGAIGKYIRLVQLDVLSDESVSLTEYVENIERINKIAIQGLESVLGRFPIK